MEYNYSYSVTRSFLCLQRVWLARLGFTVQHSSHNTTRKLNTGYSSSFYLALYLATEHYCINMEPGYDITDYVMTHLQYMNMLG